MPIDNVVVVSKCRRGRSSSSGYNHHQVADAETPAATTTAAIKAPCSVPSSSAAAAAPSTSPATAARMLNFLARLSGRRRHVRRFRSSSSSSSSTTTAAVVVAAAEPGASSRSNPTPAACGTAGVLHQQPKPAPVMDTSQQQELDLSSSRSCCRCQLEESLSSSSSSSSSSSLSSSSSWSSFPTTVKSQEQSSRDEERICCRRPSRLTSDSGDDDSCCGKTLLSCCCCGSSNSAALSSTTPSHTSTFSCTRCQSAATTHTIATTTTTTTTRRQDCSCRDCRDIVLKQRRCSPSPSRTRFSGRSSKAVALALKVRSSLSRLFCGPPYLATLLLLSYSLISVTDACSARSTPKPRPTAPTPRPNITFQMYSCPPDYAEWYCLNGATCFTVMIADSPLYNCLCSNGYIGRRCEFKDLDGTYLPSRQRIMLETAGIAGAVTIAVFLAVITFISVYIHCKRKQKELRMLSSGVDAVDGPARDPEIRPFCSRSRSLMIFMAKNPNSSTIAPSIEQTRMPSWNFPTETSTRVASINENKRLSH